MGEVLNKSRSTIAGYEINDRQPDLETLICIARYFDVSTDWILGISETRGTNEKMHVNRLEDMLIIELENCMFNPRDIRSIFKKHIKGSNPYYEIIVGYTDGEFEHLRYEINEVDKLEKDYNEFKSKIHEYNQLK